MTRGRNWILVLGLLALLQFAALAFGLVPRDVVEAIHVRRILPVIRATLGGISAVIPISLAAILVALWFVLAVGTIYEITRTLLQRGRARRRRWFFSCGFAASSVLGAWLYLLGHGWTLTRPPLGERLSLPTISSTDRGALHEEVAIATANAARRARSELTAAGDVAATDFDEVARLAREAVLAVMPELGENGALPPGNVKHSIPSGILMRFGVSGIFSPFTFEAHVDPELHPLSLPFVIAHEIAHVAGFAGEDEANFVAWLACSRSRSPLLRYSGQLVALGFFMKTAGLAGVAGPEVMKDRAAIAARWRAYRSPSLSRLQVIVWDRALKTQGVRSGIRSYREMVELMLAWHLATVPQPNTPEEEAAPKAPLKDSHEKR